MPFDPLLKPMRLGLSKQTPSRGPLDVVICGDWRLSVEALSLLPSSPLRWSQYVAAGPGDWLSEEYLVSPQ
jgi:hypothetical protein